MPKQWITVDPNSGSGYWQDYTPISRDAALEKFYANAMTPLAPDPGTTPEVTSMGPGTAPVVKFTSGGKTYYMQPALGKVVANRGTVMGEQGTMEDPGDFAIEPLMWQNYSDYDRWSGRVDGLPTMRADWAKDLVESSPYRAGGSDYAGGGWVSDKPIPTQHWQATPDESFLSSFMQGPMSVLGPAMGISSFANWMAGGPFSSGLGSLFGGNGLAGIPADLGYDFIPQNIGGLNGIPADLGFDFVPQSILERATQVGEGLLMDPATGQYILPPGVEGGGARFLPEGLLTDPATGMPILPPAVEGGAPFFPGTPGYPTIPGLPSLPGVPSTPNVPVEERSRLYDPASQAGSNNPLNIARNLGTIGAESLKAGVGGGAGGTSDLGKLRQNLSIASAVGSVLSGLSTPSQGEFASLSRASDAGRRQVINNNLKQLDDAFKGFDDNYFNSVANAFKNYYQPQVNDTFNDATKNVIYRAPGGVGSTAFAEKLGRVERDRQLADVAVGEQAQGEAQRARQTVEANRAALTGLAETSEDPGAFGAQAVATAKASAATPSYNPLADLFSRYAMLAANAGAAERAGYGGGQRAPATGGGYGGSTGGSVKTIWS